MEPWHGGQFEGLRDDSTRRPPQWFSCASVAAAGRGPEGLRTWREGLVQCSQQCFVAVNEIRSCFFSKLCHGGGSCSYAGLPRGCGCKEGERPFVCMISHIYFFFDLSDFPCHLDHRLMNLQHRGSKKWEPVLRPRWCVSMLESPEGVEDVLSIISGWS